MKRIMYILLFLLMALTILYPAINAVLARTVRYYDGPVSDHFDGRRFYLPARYAPTTPPRGPFAVWRWQLTRKPAPWPKQVVVTPHVPPALAEGLQATFIGHATVLLQLPGLTLLTDPFYSDRASPFTRVGPKRVAAPGVRFEDLPKVDVVTVSHNHYDHMDVATLARLVARDNPLIVVPLGNARFIRKVAPKARLVELDWEGEVALGQGRKLVCLPTQHWSARWEWDRNFALWGSFVLTAPEGNLYLSGDAGYNRAIFTEAGERFGPFRLALLPVGAYEPRWFMAASHMNPDDAVKAMGDLRAEHALGMHLKTVQLTDEAIDAPEAGLVEALRVHGVPAERFRTLDYGESWRLE